MTERTLQAILVPTDFSEESHKALRYAAALVRKLGAELHVVHVGEIDFAVPGPAEPGKNPLTSDTDEGRSLRQHLETLVGEAVTVQFHGRTGRAFDQIVRFARELPADLIVMSTHGRTGLKRLFLGSNAERVVQHSSSPVLVVRGEPAALTASELQIRAMLVPTDFSASSREALLGALRLARQLSARLVLLHTVIAPPVDGAAGYTVPTLELPLEQARSAAEGQMREFTSSIDFGGIDYETETAAGYPAETICDYAERRGLDLIVMSTHGRTGFMHVLIGSVAEHVVRYAHAPVLVVPATVKGEPNL